MFALKEGFVSSLVRGMPAIFPARFAHSSHAGERSDITAACALTPGAGSRDDERGPREAVLHYIWSPEREHPK
ncbi:MAG: hypothetical protein ACR2JE_08200 [Acidobacteriaceae bacterium]